MKTNYFAIEVKTPSGSWTNLHELEQSVKPFYTDLIEIVFLYDRYIEILSEQGFEGMVRVVRIAKKTDVLATASIF